MQVKTLKAVVERPSGHVPFVLCNGNEGWRLFTPNTAQSTGASCHFIQPVRWLTDVDRPWKLTRMQTSIAITVPVTVSKQSSSFLNKACN